MLLGFILRKSESNFVMYNRLKYFLTGRKRSFFDSCMGKKLLYIMFNTKESETLDYVIPCGQGL